MAHRPMMNTVARVSPRARQTSRALAQSMYWLCRRNLSRNAGSNSAYSSTCRSWYCTALRSHGGRASVGMRGRKTCAFNYLGKPQLV